MQQKQVLMFQQQQQQQQQDQLLLLQQQHQVRFQQQHMLMMQPHPGVVSPTSPLHQTVSSLNSDNVGIGSIDDQAGSTTKSNNTKGVTVAKDMKTFPQLLRDISRQKRLRDTAQKKQQGHSSERSNKRVYRRVPYATEHEETSISSER